MNVHKLKLFFHPIHFFSFGLGSGLSPFMPGTIGTIFGAIIWWIVSPFFSSFFALIFIFISIVLGVYFCEKTANALNVHDDGSIVWDEFVGIWITLFFASQIDLKTIIIAFLLFRFFDITKVWPINLADKRVPGGFGIMLDDIIAGLISGVFLYIILLLV